MFSADSLPLLATISYSITAPSLSVLKPARSTAEIWTNTSFPPPCGWTKPYPLVGLNHFTVPVATSGLPLLLRPEQWASGQSYRKEQAADIASDGNWGEKTGRAGESGSGV